jgi:hypothetical protein
MIPVFGLSRLTKDAWFINFCFQFINFVGITDRERSETLKNTMRTGIAPVVY